MESDHRIHRVTAEIANRRELDAKGEACFESQKYSFEAPFPITV